ncbi:MmgE/PrpD family protein [Pacificoceanicola onchidii]|uniref:MmgE/PrpD family protein n=1 Tax=Pacificoceanicola onchidii TaxID=2562685 RepID=UPI0010A4E14B|nr:MmgE/PrpD family protein [Pacificoceanicola onchidii]
MSVMEHLLDLAGMPGAEIPEAATQAARNSLYDWLICGRGGQGEPLARILQEMATREGGAEEASVFGLPGLYPARVAALVNGSVSHALDYDDTHFAHIGHLSVGVYPAALAMGQARGCGVAEVISAFVVGAEVAIRVGLVLTACHYNRGFHMTATAGAFGAAVAAGRLLGLSREEMRHAVGLCATRASGLKSQFGTMGKPYNAGIAASAGVECAQLASMGMTSAEDGLTGPQGFVGTHSDAPDVTAFWRDPPVERFLFEDIKYKFHACCHGTHAMIEALLALPEQVRSVAEAVHLRTNPRWLIVCDKKTPQTGLEVKFSYGWLAGMVLRGMATGDDRVYSDDLAADEALKSFAGQVTVEGDDSLSDMQAEGYVRAGGKQVPFSFDLAAPIPQAALQTALLRKGNAMIGDDASALWQQITQGGAARELATFLAGPM